MTSPTLAVRRRLAAAGSSLHVRNYRLYFVGQSVSVAGTFMQMLAIAFLTLRLTGSGTDLGIATAVRLLPFVLLGPAGGLVADRYDKRRLLFVTQTGSALGAVAFGVLDLRGAITYPVVLALSLVLGCLTVVDNPARQSLISELVGPATLANAVALNSISMNVARLVGAVAGGTLVALVGTPGCFFLNAASFAAVIASLAMMRTDEIVAAPRAPRAPGQIREGLRYAVHTPELAVPLLMLTVTGILAYEFPTTLPLLATGAFGGTAVTYGLMAAVMSVGAVVGGLVVASRASRPEPRSLAITCVGWGSAIVLAGVAPRLWACCLALAMVGYGSITFNATAKTTLQLASRPELRGRVMALWAIAWTGSSVVGAPLVGWVAEQWGSRWGLVVGGVPTVVLGLAMLPVLSRRSPTPDSTIGASTGPSAARR